MRFVAMVLLVVLIPSVVAQYVSSNSQAVCSDGVTQCQGSTFMTCAKGVWQVVSTCSGGCDDRAGCLSKSGVAKPLVVPNQSGVGKVCAQGARRCDGQDLFVCANDSWKVYQTCPELQVCTVQGCAQRQVGQVDFHTPATHTCLSCPTVPTNEFKVPLAPYEGGADDCSLQGSEGDVLRYVKFLEDLSDRCDRFSFSVRESVLAVKRNIDTQLDQLPTGTERSADYSCFAQGQPKGEQVCSVEAQVPVEQEGSSGKEGGTYVQRLERLTQETRDFCRQVDALAKPLLAACARIEYESKMCKGTRPGTIVEYHVLVEKAFAESQKKFEQLDAQYETSLKANTNVFKREFKEGALDYCSGKSEAIEKKPEGVGAQGTQRERGPLGFIVRFFDQVGAFFRRLLSSG